MYIRLILKNIIMCTYIELKLSPIPSYVGLFRTKFIVNNFCVDCIFDATVLYDSGYRDETGLEYI